MIQFGLETEVGIFRAGDGVDVVEESIALVRSARVPGAWMKWDYRGEDPHRDSRGFRVSRLRQDQDEAQFAALDQGRGTSLPEIKSDLAAINGARFYNDHAHPEYCTPECSTLQELVLHDRAGEEILADCARRRSAAVHGEVRLYKNNTDFQGHSYGCHENYLLPRHLAWPDLVRGIQSFLVTRQIFCGAGKFGREAEDRFLGPGFQLAQRSDFFSELQSVDTMQRRPIVNTRDEPHANPAKYRRFHVIIGDANMSPFATRLKVGATALVLWAILREPQRDFPRLRNPVAALKSISRDPGFRWEVETVERKTTTAIEIQRRYLEAARVYAGALDPSFQGVLEDWEEVLEDLDRDVMACRDRLDWVAKRALIGEFQTAEGVANDSSWLPSLDLEYHRLDPETGLFYGLETSGHFRFFPEASGVRQAHVKAPQTTRAAVRGACLEKFSHCVQTAQWDHLVLRTPRGPLTISLADVFRLDEVNRYLKAIRDARTPEELSDQIVLLESVNPEVSSCPNKNRNTGP